MASRRVVCIPNVSLSVNADLKRDRHSTDISPIVGQMPNVRATAWPVRIRAICSFARVHCPLNHLVFRQDCDDSPTDSRRIPHRSNSERFATDFPSDGQIDFHATLYIARNLLARRSTRCGQSYERGKKKQESQLRSMCSQSSPSRKPTQSRALCNRMRATPVPEVDLIAPDKLSFPLPRLSPSNMVTYRAPVAPSITCFRSVFRSVSVNSISYNSHVHCICIRRGLPA